MTKVDLAGVELYRQRRLQAEMQSCDIAAVILTDAVNIRYATGSRNMQVFTSRNPASRYAFVPADGPVIVFEFTGAEHLWVRRKDRGRANQPRRRGRAIPARLQDRRCAVAGRTSQSDQVER